MQLTVGGSQAHVLVSLDRGVKSLKLLTSVDEDSISVPGVAFTYRDNIVYFDTPLVSPNNLTYLTRDVEWKCGGIINILDNKLYFNLDARISNSTDHLDTDVILITSNRQGQYRRSSKMSAMVAVESQIPQTSIKENVDKVIYRLGRQMLSKYNVIPLAEMTLPFNKVYVHDQSSNNTQLLFRCRSTGYIPQCKCMLYDQIYIMNVDIEEQQDNSVFDINISDTTMVVCKSVISEALIDKDTDVKNVKITTEITNNSNQPVNVELKYYIGNQSVSPALKVVKGYIVTDVIIPGATTTSNVISFMMGL